MKQFCVRIFIWLTLVSALSACGGGSKKVPDPPPPPVDTDLTWDEDNWDEKDWV